MPSSEGLLRPGPYNSAMNATPPLIPPLFSAPALAQTTRPSHALHCDVLVRGNGIVGCTLALTLARQGLTVTLLGEPAVPSADADVRKTLQAQTEVPPSVDVRAYLLNVATQRVLAHIGQWTAALATNAVQQMQVQADGHVHHIAAQADQTLGWIVDASLLEQQLRAACAVESRIQALSTPLDASMPVHAPLQVICEGKLSRSRAALGVAVQRVYYPQTALAARLRCAKDHECVARQWFIDDGIVALLPMQLADGTPRELALVWSQPHDQARRWQQCDAEAFAAELERISSLTLGRLQLIGARQTWPLTLARAERWVGPVSASAEAGAATWSSPGFALAGDAAHGIHPLAGQGLNLGMADVACLAGVLGARESWRSLGDTRLLRRYERARAGPAQCMAASCDALQIVFMQHHPIVQKARQTAAALLAQVPSALKPTRALARFMRGV